MRGTFDRSPNPRKPPGLSVLDVAVLITVVSSIGALLMFLALWA